MVNKSAWLKKDLPYAWNTKIDKMPPGLKLLNITKDDNVLDIGCGSGLHLDFIQKEIGAKCHGVDIRTDVFNLNNKKVHLKKGSMLNLQYPDNYFDKVFSIGALEHDPNSEKVFSEVSRVLKKNGKLFFNVPYRLSLFNVTKLVKQLMGKWEMGYEKSFTINNLRSLLNKNNIKVTKIWVIPHPRVSNVFNKIDNFLNKITHGRWGFFVWVIGERTTKIKDPRAFMLQRNKEEA